MKLDLFSKASVAKAFYLNGTADGSVNGTVYMNRTSLTTLPKYEIPVLLAHEGKPGHHLQVGSISSRYIQIWARNMWV